MNLFDHMLSEDESLFVNPDALDYDYLPKLLPYRENQQSYLAECIKPLFQGRTGKNILITGKPGIGKTAAVRFVLRDLENETEAIIPIYVNCWKKDTAHKVILDICEQIGYKWVQNKKTDELIKEVANMLNKKAAVIVLDEVDKLESEQVIYELLEDIYKKCLFLITNDEEWLANLDNRVRSRLIPEVVDFYAYNAAETEGILRQRIEYAFVPKIWSDEAFELVASKTAEIGDIRTGMFLLRETGQIAENLGSRKILKAHAEQAIGKLGDFKVVSLKDLSEEDNDVFVMIKNNPNKTVTEMYEIYNKKYDKSYRTFQRKLKGLEESNLIILRENISDKGGKSSRIDLVRK